MRMLRMMFGKTLKEKIRNECIRDQTEIESITEVTRSKRLRWYKKKIGRMKKRLTEQMTSEEKNWMEMILKTEVMGENAAKNSGSLQARVNTESPKLKKQMHDDRFVKYCFYVDLRLSSLMAVFTTRNKTSCQCERFIRSRREEGQLDI